MKKKITKIYEFPVVVEKDGKKYYYAYAPSLQGCYAQGSSLVEALRNIKEAVELHLEDRMSAGESIPRRQPVSLSSIEVAV